jgi:hypothetical protein
LTNEGFRKLLSIKASLNFGLPKNFKAAFPDIVPAPKPSIENQEIKDFN